MSGPIASLKKSKKSPLIPGSLASSSNKNVPYRNPGYTAEESLLLNQIHGNVAASRLSNVSSRNEQNSSRIDPINGGVATPTPSQSKPRATKDGSPSDGELMSVMMTRLAQLEGRLQFQAKEIQEKDKKIRILEEKVQLIQKSKQAESTGSVNDLQKKCILLQQQIHEMEEFLADYGMVWVGETTDPQSEVYHDEDDDEKETDNDMVWKPEESVPGDDDFHVDYDLIIKNLEELNALAGEGIGQIDYKKDGARIKMPETLPITLYSNGMVMFSGPFRPFEDAETQECLQDIMDGYFPSELQTRYPDGVPFFVTDKRSVYFKDKTSEIFKGSGQQLGGDTKPSRLVPSNLNKSTQAKEKSNGSQPGTADIETELPGKKLSVDQFLNRLPQNVIKQGKVIDIRSSVGHAIHGSNGPNTVTVVDTEAMQEMKYRLGYDDNERPPTGKYTTLRVKDETGENTYILKMRYADTILSVRQHLTKHRSKTAPPYALMTTFPSRSYDDIYATLQECGLVPNATLHLKPTRKP